MQDDTLAVVQPELSAVYQLLSVAISQLGGSITVSRDELVTWRHRRPRTTLKEGQLVLSNDDV